MMNAINRILVILFLLATIATMPILIVALFVQREQLAVSVANFLRGLLTGPNATFNQMICIAIAAITFVIAILLLFLELQRPKMSRLKVQDVVGGQGEITASAIANRLEHAVSNIRDIQKVRPRVVSTKKGNVVDVFLEVETEPDVTVSQITQEVVSVARQVMEEKMGLKVGQLNVRLEHVRRSKKSKADETSSSQEASTL